MSCLSPWSCHCHLLCCCYSAASVAAVAFTVAMAIAVAAVVTMAATVATVVIITAFSRSHWATASVFLATRAASNGMVVRYHLF